MCLLRHCTGFITIKSTWPVTLYSELNDIQILQGEEEKSSGIFRNRKEIRLNFQLIYFQSNSGKNSITAFS